MSVTGSVDNWPVGSHHEPLAGPGELTMPVLPYAGTSGHSGSETSEERARTEDADGTTSVRQRMVLQWLSLRGDRGGTVHEFRTATNFHHGQASAALSDLHKEGRITRLTERRNKCQVYVLPIYVNGREEVPHRANKRNVPPLNHQPIRGSDVAVWLKAERDEWPQGSIPWTTIDNLLDDYRLAADTGSSLSEKEVTE